VHGQLAFDFIHRIVQCLLKNLRIVILNDDFQSHLHIGHWLSSAIAFETHHGRILAVLDFRFSFACPLSMFDPDAGVPRLNRSLVYLGACIIAGLRLAREKQVNVRVVPTRTAVEESVDLAHEVFNMVFRKVPDKLERK
jgi:hypothetical protein